MSGIFQPICGVSSALMTGSNLTIMALKEKATNDITGVISQEETDLTSHEYFCLMPSITIKKISHEAMLRQ